MIIFVVEGCICSIAWKVISRYTCRCLQYSVLIDFTRRADVFRFPALTCVRLLKVTLQGFFHISNCKKWKCGRNHIFIFISIAVFANTWIFVICFLWILHRGIYLYSFFLFHFIAFINFHIQREKQENAKQYVYMRDIQITEKSTICITTIQQ